MKNHILKRVVLVGVVGVVTFFCFSSGIDAQFAEGKYSAQAQRPIIKSK